MSGNLRRRYMTAMSTTNGASESSASTLPSGPSVPPVGGTKHECLAPIPGRMIADSEPQVSRAPEGETHNQPANENHGNTEFVFAGIREMHCGKDD